LQKQAAARGASDSGRMINEQISRLQLGYSQLTVSTSYCSVILSYRSCSFVSVCRICSFNSRTKGCNKTKFMWMFPEPV